jgi:hypothetical protein
MAVSPPNGYAGFNEPESAANTEYQPAYGYNYVIHTTRGSSFEMDDTPGRERIRLQHRGFDDGRPGSFIEMHPNGDQVEKIMGSGYEIIANNKNVLISGNCNVTIVGNASLTIQGNKTEDIFGNLEQHVRGNYSQVVEGISTFTSRGDMTLTGGSFGTGSITLSPGGYVYVDGSIYTDGEITATKMTSATRVDAGTGISAGKDGFVTLLGGLSIGFPIPIAGQINVSGPLGVPGRIFCTGPITSLMSVTAPLGSFGIMSAVLMTDIVNSSIFRAHVHTAKGAGPTLTPFMGGGGDSDVGGV